MSYRRQGRFAWTLQTGREVGRAAASAPDYTNATTAGQHISPIFFLTPEYAIDFAQCVRFPATQSRTAHRADSGRGGLPRHSGPAPR